MADQHLSFTIGVTPDGKALVIQNLNGVQVHGVNQQDVLKLDLSNPQSSYTIQVDAKPQPVPFADWAVLATIVAFTLAVLIATGAVLWQCIVPSGNLTKTVDKLAQLLSEESGPQKMSLSRVQALLFTYVITFGSLLIIANTGRFPDAIPTDLAILAGGSLGTYVVSKAIQRNTSNGQSNNPAKPPGG
ncbi:MAG TPA: hypothetical protein VMI52_02905 [Acetobacteraceae bacterium]|nr:hypothetical protein [Acetobacteraceae bacterium]